MQRMGKTLKETRRKRFCHVICPLLSFQIHIKLDFDRSAKEFVIYKDEYTLVLDNINDDDVEFEVKSRSMERLDSGVLAGQKNHDLRVKFIPSIADRQYVLVSFILLLLSIVQVKYYRIADQQVRPMIGVCVQRVSVQ